MKSLRQTRRVALAATCICLSAFVSVVCPPTRAAEIAAWGSNNGGQTNVPAGLSNVVAVAGGGSHSLALRADGTLAAWASGGATIVPAGLSNVVAVAAGGSYSLALRVDGTVAAWGQGASEYDEVPATVPLGLSNVVAVAAGNLHSLALRADGTVAAWRQCSSEYYWVSATVPEGLGNVVAVAAGDSHGLALRADGTVAAWGSYRGRATFDHPVPATVPVGLSNVVAVAGGDSHSLALRADGTVAAWGYNYDGQTNVPSGLTNVVAVAAGNLHSLALQADGTVVAWGSNWAGQTNVPAGLSNVVAVAGGGSHSLALTGLPGGIAAPQLVGSPFLIGTVDRPFHHRILAKNGPTGYSASGLPPGLVVDPFSGLITGQPAAAGTYSVVLSATNASGTGQWTVTLVVNLPLPGVAGELVWAILGNGLNYRVVTVNAPEWQAASGLPSGLTIDSSSGVISGTPLELGDFPVSVAVSNRYGTASGTLMIRVLPVAAWGSNTYGQTNVPAGLSNVVAVAGGGSHSLALRADGTVAAWGSGSATNVPAGLSNVVAVAGGDSHSLALRADGTVAAWGNNYYGQTNVPAGLSSTVAVAGGGSHSLALRADGTVAAWGSGSATNVPAGLSNVVAVAAGRNHSLALRADGTVAAWGSGSATNVPAGLSNVVAVAGGGSCSLALQADGTVAAWGSGISTIVPAGLSNVVAVAAGRNHSLVLRADGTVVAWGWCYNGLIDVPATVPDGLSNVVAVAAGGADSLALIYTGNNPLILGSAAIRSPARSGQILAGDCLRFLGGGSFALQSQTLSQSLWSFGAGRTSSLSDPGLVIFPSPGAWQVTYTLAAMGGRVTTRTATRRVTVVASTNAVPDLAVTALDLSANLILDQPIELSYTVANLGEAALSGTNWHDALYFSSDPYLDSGDWRLTSVPVAPNLGPGQSYTKMLAITIPLSLVEQGGRYLILSVDDEWQVLERHQLNNEWAVAVHEAIPRLAVGVPLAGSVAASGNARYYRFDAPAGQPLLVTLDDANDIGQNELYIRHGDLPTRSAYDARHISGLGADQKAGIPITAAGPYYILGYAESAPDAPTGFTITAQLPQAAILDVTPKQAGNRGDATVRLAGGGFQGGDRVELVSPTNSVLAA